MPVTRGRIAALDAVRVLAIAAMVFGDAQVVAGIFLCLAGWLWQPMRPMRQEWRARSRSVLIPVASWLVLAVAAWVVLQLIGSGGVGSGGVGSGGVGAGDPGAGEFGHVAAFGLVPAFAGLCLVRRSLDRFGDGAAGVVLVVWLGSYLVGWWLVGVPDLIGTGLAALVLLVAGERARAWTASLRRPVLTGLALATGSLGLLGTGLVSPLDPARVDPGTPVVGTVAVAAISWGVLLLAGAGARRIAPTVRWIRAGAGLAALARVAVPALLGQAVLLSALGPVLPAGLAGGLAGGLPGPGARAGDSLVVVALGLISWAVALLLPRTPLSRYLVGEHPAPARPRLRVVRPTEPPPARPSHLTVVRIPEPRSPVADSRFL